jgi:hypothetical protein
VSGDFVEVSIFWVGKAAVGILAGEKDNITSFMHCWLEDVVRGRGDLLH